MFPRRAVTDIGHEGMPPRIRTQIVEYRADASDSVNFRLYGLIGLGVIGFLCLTTLRAQWSDPKTAVGALGVLAVCGGLGFWLWRSRGERVRAIDAMRLAATQGPWVQVRVLEAREMYFGRVQRKWSFTRTQVSVDFVDPSGQHRRAALTTFVHYSEAKLLQPGAVLNVRLHPTDPNVFFLPPLT